MTQLTPAHIVRIYTRMGHLYAHRWTSQYGTAMNDAGTDLSESAKQWLYDLRDYSVEQVGYGLQQIELKRPEWPPGPIEFMNLCDDVPSLAQIMDMNISRYGNSNVIDHGPVCAFIRSQIDWYNIGGMSASDARKAIAAKRDDVLELLRINGKLKQLAAQRFEALEKKS